jgi:hypothetical protein
MIISGIAGCFVWNIMVRGPVRHYFKIKKKSLQYWHGIKFLSMCVLSDVKAERAAPSLLLLFAHIHG